MIAVNGVPIDNVSAIGIPITKTPIYMLIIVIICNIIRNNYYSHFAKRYY